MIRFFRLNDPLRIAFLFGLLLLVRLPLLINGLYLTKAEQDWLLLGAKLAEGSTIFVDVWDPTGPIAAGLYALFGWLAPMKALPLQLFAIVLVTYQAWLFNSVMVRFNVFKEKTFVPGLMYVLFMHISFDFLILSPVLIAITFLLMVLRALLRPGEARADARVFRTGFYLGLAVLSWLPSVAFLPLVLLTYILYKSSSVRYLMLILYGLGLPILLFTAGMWYFGPVRNLLYNYFYSLITVEREAFVPTTSMLYIGVLPLTLLVIGWLRTFTERGFVNYQVNCQRIMILWALFSAIALLLCREMAPYQLMIFVPVLAFFTAHYVLLFRRRFVAEIAGIGIAALLAASAYVTYMAGANNYEKFSFDRYMVASPEGFSVKNKRILVLGPEREYYHGNQLASPYLNWQLADQHFKNLDNMQVLSSMQENLLNDVPEVIVDKHGLAKAVFERLPQVAKLYQPKGDIYYLKQQGQALNQ